MTNFKRSVSDFLAFQNQWNSNPFLHRIDEELISVGKALLTFRNNNVTVYYKGRQLCTMPRRTNGQNVSAYVPTIYNYYLPFVRSKVSEKTIKKENYDESKYIQQVRFFSFSDVIPEILENMDKEKDPESYQISNFYKFSPMVYGNDSEIILLDIEAAFSATGEKTNRIDMVLYHTIERRLIFVEVKRLSDKRLYSQNNNPAEILKQLSEYRTLLNVNRSTVIKQYNNVINYYNQLSEKQIPTMNEESELLLGLLVVECNKNTESTAGYQKLCDSVRDAGFKMHIYGETRNVTKGTLRSLYNTFK